MNGNELGRLYPGTLFREVFLKKLVVSTQKVAPERSSGIRANRCVFEANIKTKHLAQSPASKTRNPALLSPASPKHLAVMGIRSCSLSIVGYHQLLSTFINHYAFFMGQREHVAVPQMRLRGGCEPRHGNFSTDMAVSYRSGV